MEQVGDLLQALLAGLLCGFVVSVPVGPVNLTVVNRALRKGFLAAFLAGVGAVCAETLYAGLMLMSHSSVLEMPVVRDGLRILAVVVMAGMGVRNLLIQPASLAARNAAVVERADERWHHPRSFLLGFVLTITNLMLVLLWATLSAALLARNWVEPVLQSRVACLAGVFFGGVLWFFLVAFFVSRAHRRVSDRTLTILMRACGVVFLGFAVLLAHRLFFAAGR